MSQFYRAFEEKHRGSRKLIKSRLTIYLPFLNVLEELNQHLHVIDLGCGRGEWLELMREQGHSALGVDLDNGMLKACHDRNLDVVNEDVITFLKRQGNESCDVVSGFHIAEHIHFDDLQILVKEALRILKPAGLLILETPNPENLVVGTNNFYLDPTHLKPIPNELLQFVVDFAGFAQSKVVRLQESVEINDARYLTLRDVLAGVSPDYAIVAQKFEVESTLEKFKPLFEKSYGLSLTELSERYQQSQSELLNGIKALAEKSIMETTSIMDSLSKDMRANDTSQMKLISELKKDQARQFSELQRLVFEQKEELHEGILKSNKQKTELNEQSFKQYIDFLQSELATIRGERNKFISLTDELKKELVDTRNELNASLGNAHNWYLRAVSLQQELDALKRKNIGSWWGALLIKRLLHKLRRCLRYVVEIVKLPMIWLVKSLMTKVLANPKRATRVNNFLERRTPFLHRHLRQFAINRKIIKLSSSSESEIKAHEDNKSIHSRQSELFFNGIKNEIERMK